MSEAEYGEMAALLTAWVKHYEQVAPDDANPSDPEWPLWVQSRDLLHQISTQGDLDDLDRTR